VEAQAARINHPHWDHFQEICREAGLKMTHQRMLIYQELASRHDHPSAEDLFAALQSQIPTMALDTVYRTLRLLESIKAIRKLEVSDERARFDANLEPHHHCICDRCKSVVDFQWETFDLLDLPEKAAEWGPIWSKSLVLRGVCRKCLTQGAALGK
jgi:Fur family peroxide stress response transcriptional regulator